MLFPTALPVLLAALSIPSSTLAHVLSARQSLPPSCAQPCLTPARADFGSCGAMDNLCLCQNQRFVDTSTACIFQSCRGDDLQQAVTFAQSICSAFKITLTTTFTATAPAANGPESTSGVSASTTPASPGSTTSTSAVSAASGSGNPSSSSSSSTSASNPSNSQSPGTNGASSSLPPTTAFGTVLVLAGAALAFFA